MELTERLEEAYLQCDSYDEMAQFVGVGATAERCRAKWAKDHPMDRQDIDLGRTAVPPVLSRAERMKQRYGEDYCESQKSGPSVSAERDSGSQHSQESVEEVVEVYRRVKWTPEMVID